MKIPLYPSGRQNSLLLMLILLLLTQTALLAQNNVPVNSSAYDAACFLAPGFPAADTPEPDTASIKAALKGLSVKYFVSVNDFVQLTRDKFKLLILPYGSAFPADAWQHIYSFVSSGGSFVYIGGYPFHQPVFWKPDTAGRAGRWVMGTRQPTYARMLHIGPADTVLTASAPFYTAEGGLKFLSGFAPEDNLPIPTKVFPLTVRFSNTKDFSDEDGSAGQRSAVIRPLIHIINGNGKPFAAPLIEIDRLQGSEAGGRWIIAPSDITVGGPMLRRLVNRALEGASLLTAVPVNASVYPGEIPRLRINRFRPGKNGKSGSEEIIITLFAPGGKEIFRKTVRLEGYGGFLTTEVLLDAERRWGKGLYKAEVKSLDNSISTEAVNTGFWVMDDELMKSGPALSVSSDWLMKNGKPFPVIGTTYMAFDVHRKFLLEANPYRWDEDMEAMKKEGINFIRTGIWTGWRRMMLDPGSIDESALRALDAFVLTAAKHNILVCFTFFAFTPPLNGGSNPYLDPRALDWQKIFITMITSRYKDVTWMHYDLINEPSYSPPSELWNMLPVRDAYEESAWKMWINNKHKDIQALAGKWRCDINGIYTLPGRNELAYSRIRENRLFRKAMDFALFTQDAVTRWADTLNKVIKSTAGDAALVTLGQDEGGTSLRPSQQFHYTAVDYTSMHTWWYNDDLLWDALFSKVPEKPNLISETGIMRLEDIDGEPWLNPRGAEKLLDRKFAFGFAGRAAGVVEWVWNINPYMPLDNEAVIGFIRPDGTYKPEISVISKYAGFFKKAETYLSDYYKSEVVIVIPHSRIFSARPSSGTGTQQMVRVLSDVLGIAPQMISEYKLSDSRLDGVKLILVPSCEMLSDSAAKYLHNAALRGTKVLFTGAVEGNEYGLFSDEFRRLGLNTASRPVSKYEITGGADSAVVFDAGQTVYLKRSTLTSMQINGNIIHEPLPLEMSGRREPLINLLKTALGLSGVIYSHGGVPASVSVHKTEKTALITCVNESAADIIREIAAGGYTYSLRVKAGSAVLILIDLKDGSILASTENDESYTNN